MPRKPTRIPGVTVRQRGKAWQAQVRVGKDPRTGKYVYRCTTTDTEAEAWEAGRRILAEGEKQQAAHVEPTRLTLGEFLEQWLARKEQKRRGTTVEQYARLVRLHITPALGGMPLQDISPLKVQTLLDTMGPRRITELTRGLLVDALGQAERMGFITTNAAARTELPGRQKAKRPSFTLEEADTLFAATEKTRIGPLVRFVFYTGLRRGEALGLHWSDVTWSPSAVAIRRKVDVLAGRPSVDEIAGSKTAAGIREVPLVAPALEALRAQKAQQASERLRAGIQWKDEDWVFSNRVGGVGDPNDVGRAFRALVRRAGVSPRPFHALRHSTASILLGAGVTPELAAKIMGHKDLRTFYTTYSDLLRPAAQEAARQVEGFLARASTQSAPSTHDGGGTLPAPADKRKRPR